MSYFVYYHVALTATVSFLCSITTPFSAHLFLSISLYETEHAYCTHSIEPLESNVGLTCPHFPQPVSVLPTSL